MVSQSPFPALAHTGINDATDGDLTIIAEFKGRTDMSKIKSFETKKVNRMTL